MADITQPDYLALVPSAINQLSHGDLKPFGTPWSVLLHLHMGHLSPVKVNWIAPSIDFIILIM